MKKIILSLLTLVLTVPMFSQGFASFSVDGALQPAVIKNIVEKTSLVEVLVGEKTDIKNLKYKYKLYSGCTLSPELTPNFTHAQTVVINKNDGTSKEWLVEVKQLKAASLPLEQKFSEANPSISNNENIGWAGMGTDPRITNTIRFGNKGVSFWVAINQSASKVEYQLKMVSKEKVSFDGEFVVETSKDGKSWKVLKEFDERNPMSADGNYSHEITNDVRFIRWTYFTRNKLNLNLNNIIVTTNK